MSVKFSNNGHSTLAASLASNGTSITVASGHGARFPSLSSGEYFYATLIDASNNLEIVKVTGRSSDVLTATRAQESTTARAYAIGDRIELRVTAQGLTDATTIANDSITTALIADNAVTAAKLNISGNGTAGEAVLSDGDGSFSYGTAGGIRQIKQQTANGEYTTSSTSFQDTGLISLSFDNNILSGSKVLAQVECFISEVQAGGWAQQHAISIFNDSTNLGNDGFSGVRTIHAAVMGNSGSNQYQNMMVYGSILHTPADTHPTYTVRLKTRGWNVTMGSLANTSSVYNTGGTRLTIYEVTV
jgi:ribosomal protein L18|tara:strand:- start:178 stop:1083 length:906 start_codon:yes stop_codon:yes gene_type:complete